MTVFRKIRKKLLDSGKLKSYLAYAFGEILLIAIGILIALKINDLNEIRKNRIVELKIYESLYDELNTNLKILNTSIDRYSESSKRLEGTMNYIGLPPEQITEGVKDTIVHINYSEINLLEGALNSVISTTKFELIESDSLKSLITNYPAEIQKLKSIDSKIKEIVLDRLQPSLEKHLALKDILSKDNPKYMRIQEFGEQSNYNDLLHSKDYQNSLVDRFLQTENLLTSAKKLRNRTQVMSLKLRKELGYTL
ncbi:hypothetical protein [Zobellia laminariae]|uniref:hypothetical protein n=1 Tax=Zobellia laminariae TaxID=248906 RepID=UPI0026F479CA|nr:hypothetical protein [Zobellia laminariae]WKX74657.1 hypothetical protein Q5W13_12625 [Zobellia laminariae]